MDSEILLDESGELEPGSYLLEIEAYSSAYAGRNLAQGLYFLVLKSGDQVRRHKIMLVN